MRSMLKRKQRLELNEEQLKLTGIGRDNINNVFTIFYCAILTEDQTKNLLEKRGVESGEKVIYVVPADADLLYIERLLEHRDISRWNPLGYANLLYALAYTNLRSKEEIEKLFAKTGQLEKPLAYTYPMEQHIV